MEQLLVDTKNNVEGVESKLIQQLQEMQAELKVAHENVQSVNVEVQVAENRTAHAEEHAQNMQTKFETVQKKLKDANATTAELQRSTTELQLQVEEAAGKAAKHKQISVENADQVAILQVECDRMRDTLENTAFEDSSAIRRLEAELKLKNKKIESNEDKYNQLQLESANSTDVHLGVVEELRASTQQSVDEFEKMVNIEREAANVKDTQFAALKETVEGLTKQLHETVDQKDQLVTRHARRVTELESQVKQLNNARYIVDAAQLEAETQVCTLKDSLATAQEALAEMRERAADWVELSAQKKAVEETVAELRQELASFTNNTEETQDKHNRDLAEAQLDVSAAENRVQALEKEQEHARVDARQAMSALIESHREQLDGVNEQLRVLKASTAAGQDELKSKLQAQNDMRNKAESRARMLQATLELAQAELAEVKEKVTDWVEISALNAVLERQAEELKEEAVGLKEDAKAAKASHNAELNEAQDALTNIGQQLQELQHEQQKVGIESRETANDLIDSHRQQLTDVKDELRKLKSSSALAENKLNVDLQSQDVACREAESRAVMLQETLALTQVELAEAREKIVDWVELSANKSMIELEVDELKRDLAAAQDEATARQSALKMDRANTQANASAADKQIKTLQQQQQKMEADARGKEKNMIEAHRRETSDFKNKLTKAKHNAKLLADAIATMENAVTATSTELMDLRKEQDERVQVHEEQIAAVELAAAEVAAKLQSKLNQLKTDYANSEAALRLEFKLANENLTSQLQMQGEARRKADSRSSMLQETLDLTQIELAECRAKITDRIQLSANNSIMEQEVDELKHEMAKAKQDAKLAHDSLAAELVSAKDVASAAVKQLQDVQMQQQEMAIEGHRKENSVTESHRRQLMEVSNNLRTAKEEKNRCDVKVTKLDAVVADMSTELITLQKTREESHQIYEQQIAAIKSESMAVAKKLRQKLEQQKQEALSTEVSLDAAFKGMQANLKGEVQTQSAARRKAESRASMLQEKINLTQTELTEARDKLGDWVQLSANKSVLVQEAGLIKHELAKAKRDAKSANDGLNAELANAREDASAAEKQLRNLQLQQKQMDAKVRRQKKEATELHRRQMAEVTDKLRKAHHTKQQYETAVKTMEKTVASVTVDLSGWQKQYSNFRQIHKEQIAAAKKAGEDEIIHLRSQLAEYKADVLNVTVDLKRENEQTNSDLALTEKQLDSAKEQLDGLAQQMQQQQIDSLSVQQDLHTSYQQQLRNFGEQVSNAKNDCLLHTQTTATMKAKTDQLLGDLSEAKVAQRAAESMVVSLTDTLNKTRNELDQSRLRLAETDGMSFDASSSTQASLPSWSKGMEQNGSIVASIESIERHEEAGVRKLEAGDIEPGDVLLSESYKQLVADHAKLRSHADTMEESYSKKSEQRLGQVKEQVNQLVQELCDSKDKEIADLRQRLIDLGEDIGDVTETQREHVLELEQKLRLQLSPRIEEHERPLSAQGSRASLSPEAQSTCFVDRHGKGNGKFYAGGDWHAECGG